MVHSYITADAIHASARNMNKVKSGVSLRCARSILVPYSCWCIRLTTRAWKTDYTACHPGKDYHIYIECIFIFYNTEYILPVVPITTHTHVKLKSIGKKETKRRKGDKGKERKENTRKARKDRTRRGSKERKKEKKLSYYS